MVEAYRLHILSAVDISGCTEHFCSNKAIVITCEILYNDHFKHHIIANLVSTTKITAISVIDNNTVADHNVSLFSFLRIMMHISQFS